MQTSLKRMLRPVASAVLRLPPLRGVTVVEMDGGICSQMHFYLVGRWFAERGRDVRFSMLWYDECGMDCDGVFVRNFDLLRLFPSLDMPTVPGLTAKMYRLGARYDNGIQTLTPAEVDARTGRTAYLDGYYLLPPDDFTRLFHQYFSLDKTADAGDAEMLRSIRADEGAVAIHVRRGDLKREAPTYGRPVDTDYFIRAAQRASELVTGARFYIFSDEPEWCMEHLQPLLPDSRVVAGNGSDRGYADLVLMASCRGIVGSKGSMSKYAALLADADVPLILADTEEERRFANVYHNIHFV